MEEFKPISPMLEEMKRYDYLNENIIYFDDEFDRESCTLFCRQLRKLGDQELKKKEEERKPIKIYISSYGGNVMDYYTVASTIEYYKNRGIIIATYCMGYACSAGAKLLIIGSKGHRYCTKYASILLHQIQTGQYGNMTLQEKIADARQTEKDWGVLKGIIKENTELTDEEIDNFTRLNLDVWFSPQEALEKGIVDHILV